MSHLPNLAIVPQGIMVALMTAADSVCYVAPFMMPVSGKYRDLGTMIEGKIEAGVIKKTQNYTLMPNRDVISISALYGETEEEVGMTDKTSTIS